MKRLLFLTFLSCTLLAGVLGTSQFGTSVTAICDAELECGASCEGVLECTVDPVSCKVTCDGDDDWCGSHMFERWISVGCCGPGNAYEKIQFQYRCDSTTPWITPDPPKCSANPCPEW